MHLRASRPGYTFLLMVLIIGSIAAAATASLLLLSGAAEQSGNTVVNSAQAWEYAQTCAERAMRSLRADPTYAGGETFSFTYGTCQLLGIGGSGNEHRTICAEGVSNDATRRLEVVVTDLFPTVRIASWLEVSAFTQCL